MSFQRGMTHIGIALRDAVVHPVAGERLGAGPEDVLNQQEASLAAGLH